LAARDEDGTGALLGPLASLTRVDACNPPTASAPDLGAGRTRRPRDLHLSHARLRPPRLFPPSRSPTRSTHLGWGTRHTHSSAQGPPGLETPTPGHTSCWRNWRSTHALRPRLLPLSLRRHAQRHPAHPLRDLMHPTVANATAVVADAMDAAATERELGLHLVPK
jgi:hypothetical protein